MLGDLMLPSARNRTGIYFFHDLVSEPVVALEILTMEPTERVGYREFLPTKACPCTEKAP